SGRRQGRWIAARNADTYILRKGPGFSLSPGGGGVTAGVCPGCGVGTRSLTPRALWNSMRRLMLTPRQGISGPHAENLLSLARVIKASVDDLAGARIQLAQT